MAVDLSRAGNTATVTVTVDVTDLVAAVGLSNAEKRFQAARRAQQQLADAIRASALTDAQIDADATAAASQATYLKSIRPTGSF